LHIIIKTKGYVQLGMLPHAALDFKMIYEKKKNGSEQINIGV